MVIRNKKEYSTGEAAEILGISRVAVLKRIKSGSLPARKIGRNYIINAADIAPVSGEELLESQKQIIKKVVKKAVSEYRDVFEKLAEE